MMGRLKVLAVIAALTTVVLAQDNSSPKIPDHLIQCYSNQSYYHRENRLPATLRSFLDLLRAVESSPSGRNMNAQDLAASLQYFLRLDGIEPSPVQSSNSDPSILPFAPMGDEFFRHRVMLIRLLSKPPQPDYRFFLESLTVKQMCNLHFMLSYSTDTTKRVDEQCSNSILETQGTARRRFGRSVDRSTRRKREDEESAVVPDVEIFPPQVMNEVEKTKSNGSDSTEVNKNSDFRIGRNDLLTQSFEPPLRGGIVRSSERKVIRPTYDSQKILPNVERSSCPVENGVIRTSSGTVAIGAVVAGVAAGLRRQRIAPTLLGVTREEIPTDLAATQIDNLWAVTLAGDLTDLILAVGTLGDSVNEAVGLKGGWNNTFNPKWYLLQEDSPAYVTDSQLRGAIDGLWLGKNVDKWDRDNTKLSQILDMYYSPQGIPGTNLQACNRRNTFAEYAPDTEFSPQLELFSLVMQKQRVNSATITDFTTLVGNTVNNVKHYIPSFESGSQCSVGSQNQASTYTDYSLNLLVVVDNSWPNGALNDIFAILLDNEAIATPYTSNTTIICGRDGSVLYQGSDAASFSANFTTATLNSCASGMDLLGTMYNVEVYFRQLYQQEKTLDQTKRGSYAALLLPYSASSTAGTAGIWEKKQLFNTSLPDVKLIVATSSGNRDAYSTVVDDVNEDVLIIQPPDPRNPTSSEQIKAVATRLQSIPQRLSNPVCGSYFDEDRWNTGRITDNVRQGFTKFYRLHPNYFYKTTAKPKVTINSKSGQSQLTVCVSRTNPTPLGSGDTGSDPGSNINPKYPQNPNDNWNQPQNPQSSWNQPQNPQNQWRPRSYNSPYTSMGRQTATDAQCVTVTRGSMEVPVDEDPCSDYSYINTCPPIYISVTVPFSSTMPPSQCRQECRLPTNAEYEITIENLSCASGAAQILLHPITLAMTAILFLFRNLM